jgi:hypothetical protein
MIMQDHEKDQKTVPAWLLPQGQKQHLTFTLR